MRHSHLKIINFINKDMLAVVAQWQSHCLATGSIPGKVGNINKKISPYYIVRHYGTAGISDFQKCRITKGWLYICTVSKLICTI